MLNMEMRFKLTKSNAENSFLWDFYMSRWNEYLKNGRWSTKSGSVRCVQWTILPIPTHLHVQVNVGCETQSIASVIEFILHALGRDRAEQNRPKR